MKAATETAPAEDMEQIFQSTPPVKAATQITGGEEISARFQSTPPVKAATFTSPFFVGCSGISIHAAREGGDVGFILYACAFSISIHAAREGGDLALEVAIFVFGRFQSTPPVKAATISAQYSVIRRLFQSTPPVKAATVIVSRIIRTGCISIHAAREGGDPLPSAATQKQHKFQSTPPVKAATSKNLSASSSLRISIHAAREGGDLAVLTLKSRKIISIHAAREGGDERTYAHATFDLVFQSTPPVKAATIFALRSAH